MKSFIKNAPKEFEEDIMTMERYCAQTSAYRDLAEEERRDEYRRYMQDVAAALSLALFGLAGMLLLMIAFTDPQRNSNWGYERGVHSGINLAG